MAELDGNPGGGAPDPSSGFQAQFRDDLKSNEAFTGFKTISEFGDKYLETQGKVTELEGKLENSFQKLPENATPEQTQAYHESLGKPQKPEGYDFPKGEGVEHDPKMTDWAREVFHKANLSTEQAAVVSQDWDAFLQELVKKHDEGVENQLKDIDTKLREDWKTKEEYDKNMELSARAFKHFSGEELKEFKAHPTLIKAFFKIGEAMGEDFSLPGETNKGDPTKPGMIYDMPDF
jgi:hypothetical protein